MDNLTNRRTLIEQLATLSSGTSLLSSKVSAAQQVNPPQMTLGFSTYGMPKMPTEAALRIVSEVGFDSVEIVVREGWDADSAKLSGARLKSIRSELVRQNLRLRSLMEHVFPTSAKSNVKALRRLKLAANVAHELSPDSLPIVQTVLGSGDFGSKKNELVDLLGAWAELSESESIVICIKPHRGGIVSRPAEAVWLLEQLKFPTALKMVYDYSHYVFRGISVRESLENSGNCIAHVAVKDTKLNGEKAVFQLPGEAGSIDYPEILRYLKAANYSGDINCEVSGMVSSQSGYDPVRAANICYKYMARVFEQTEIARPS